jgi:hypothetical protein
MPPPENTDTILCTKCAQPLPPSTIEQPDNSHCSKCGQLLPVAPSLHHVAINVALPSNSKFKCKLILS